MPKKPKWKYSKNAKKTRHCNLCHKRLRKQEASLCKECYIEHINEVRHEHH